MTVTAMTAPRWLNPAALLASQKIRNAKGILLDWDGSMAIGNQMLPSAQRLMSRIADRAVILSNNSTHLPEDIARLLEREDVFIPPERILLAGVETIRWAAENGPRRVLLMGSPTLAGFARSLGLEISRDAREMI